MITVMGPSVFYVGGCVCSFKMWTNQTTWEWSLCVFLQVRSGCAFMVHVCQDEHQLYNEFFSKHTPKLEWVSATFFYIEHTLNTQTVIAAVFV